VQVRHERAEIDGLEELILQAVERLDYPKSSRFAVRLALEEALANAFTHGHRTLPPRTPVSVEYAIGADELTIRVEDQGPGFTPAAVADPTTDENLDLPSGRGLMLMRAYMSSVTHNAKGNVVTMRYRRPPES